MTVDTLKIVDIFRKAGVKPEVAEAHAKAFREVVQEDLATKADIDSLKSEIDLLQSNLENKISGSKIEIIGYIVAAIAIIEFLGRAL